MNGSSQVPPGERSGSDGSDGSAGADGDSTDPIALIEQALVTMRRDQQQRRLQRRGGHGDGHRHGGHGGDGDHDRERDHERGRRWGGPRGGRGDGGGHIDRGAPDDGAHDHAPGEARGMPSRHGLAHAARFRLLDALEGAEHPPSVSQLAEAIGVDQPRASRLVQAAVEAGHVRREADPSDARRSALVLTAAGRTLLASARDTRRSAVETALAGFTPAETAEFARLFSRFIAAWPRD
ncbi:MarR family winged helix-turn-helix transcriptional regulator [Agromyces subbeticus]|uniref:MarR family winged helix-turn-helix transcriptional regulator n=1 Tax=Agromyces subbeticus TaxID=293890 RepID=UPI0009FFBD38|nr:MarR family winged helix-turn-helix transcriptional regulator [Agromyces subbeticus]